MSSGVPSVSASLFRTLPRPRSLSPNTSAATRLYSASSSRWSAEHGQDRREGSRGKPGARPQGDAGDHRWTFARPSRVTAVSIGIFPEAVTAAALGYRAAALRRAQALIGLAE